MKYNKIPNLSREEELVLFKEYGAITCPIRLKVISDKLVMSNVGMIYNIGKKLYRDNTELKEDLFMEGVIGILEAIPKFDYTKNYRFITFASYYIFKTMMDFMNRNSLIRVSKYTMLNNKNIIEFIEDYTNENDIAPSEDLLTELFKDQYKNYKNSSGIKDIYSLDFEQSFTNNLKDDYDINKSVSDKIMSDNLLKFMKEKLSIREYEVITLRYGLDNKKQHSLKEIGLLLGISRSRIQQIQASSENKLKDKRINFT